MTGHCLLSHFTRLCIRLILLNCERPFIGEGADKWSFLCVIEHKGATINVAAYL